jgi:hypothetical protein
VQVAKEALARSAERKECHRYSNPYVDADIAHLSLVSELPRRGTACSENARLVSVAAGVDDGNGCVDVVDVMDREHGPEDFGPRDRAFVIEPTVERPLRPPECGVEPFALRTAEVFSRHQNRQASDSHVQTAAMPMWSRNRGELFLLADSRRNLLMSVTVDDSGGAPRLEAIS